MYPFPKDGSSLSLGNQRGVDKSSAISKIRNKILHGFKPVSESKLFGSQGGARCGRSTTEQIMTPRFLLDAARTHKHSLAVVFFDYCKAFDSVVRRAIPQVFRHYDVPDPVVADLMQLYHGSSAAVYNRFGLTDTFDTTSGVLQGDTLSSHIRQSLVDEDEFTL